MLDVVVRKPSYLALAGQLVLLVVAGSLLAVVLAPWSVQLPVYAAAILGSALVLRTVSGRRMWGAYDASPAALARCSVVLPAERWPVGRLWQLRIGRTRRAWAPGVLGVAAGGLVSFVPRAERWTDRAWQDRAKAVQVKALWPGTVVALRVHGAANGTAQLTVTSTEEEVRAQLAPYLPLVDGWDTSAGPPSREPEVTPPQRSWPQVYAVRLELADGSAADYDVVTWLNAAKAEALAVGRHTHLHGAGPAVLHVHVQDVGPAPRDARGLVAIPRGAAFDREEF